MTSKNICLFYAVLSLLNLSISQWLSAQEPVLSDSLLIRLDEISITAHNEFVQRKPDGYVVQIAGNVEIKGRETSDVLKQLPALLVKDNALGMMGKTGVVVYVDNRIVRLEGQTLLNYLNSLPPDIIKSVEILTTPPVRYDAAENVGVVNIVTKRNILPGWKGNLRAGCLKNTYSAYTASSFLNYRGKKFFLDANLFYSDFSSLNHTRYAAFFPNETMEVSNPKKWRSSESTLHSVLGYEFGDKTMVAFDVYVPLYNRSLITDIENTTRFLGLTGSVIDSTLYSNGASNNTNNTVNIGLFFKHRFNDRSHFTINADYLNNRTKNNREFTTCVEKNGVTFPSEQYFAKGHLNHDILTAQTGFTFPLFTCTAQTGYKASFIHTASDNRFQGDTEQVDKFDYRENIHALYYSMEKQLEKWSFKAGVRAEMTLAAGRSLSTGETHKDSYPKLFPTVHLSRKINDFSDFSLAYTDRIERPPYQYLDPFKWYISKYDYAVGNPFLKPSRIKNLEINYLYKDAFSATLYGSYQKDKIGRMVLLDSLDVTHQVQKADNFLNVGSMGVKLYAMIHSADWYRVVLQGDIGYCDYTSNRAEFLPVSGFNAVFVASNTFSITRKFQIICDLEERIPGLYEFREMKNAFNLGLGASYSWQEKGLEFRLYANDILKTAEPEYAYTSGGVRQLYRNYFDSRYVRLMLVWNFGNWFNGSIAVPQSNEEEQQRL